MSIYGRETLHSKETQSKCYNHNILIQCFIAEENTVKLFYLDILSEIEWVVTFKG